MEKEAFAKAWDWRQDHDLRTWLTPSEEAMWLSLKWQGRKRFLDFGCGLGRHSLYFASLGYEVKGFDLSEDAVLSTDRLLKEKGFAGTFVQADMHHVPFEDGCCDCLLAYHVASHTTLEGLSKVVKEIHRLLDEGGECYLDLCAEDSFTAVGCGYPRIDECTVLPDKGEEIGIPHCCPDYARVKNLFASFSSVRIEKKALLYEDGKEFAGGGHYWIYARK